MESRYYTVVTGKDNFIAQIIDEGQQIETAGSEGKEYITNFGKKGPLVLTNIAILVPSGEGKMGILPFKEVAFGNEFVTVPASAVTEIYFVTKDLETQVKAALAGLALAPK